MKNRSIPLALAFIIITSVVAPILYADQVEWDYNSYLYLFDILEYDEPLTAGRTNHISIQVGANTQVTVHVEFKGSFSWGEWTFYSQEIPMEAGLTTLGVDMEMPIKTIVEPTCTYYYYTYITLPGDGWAPYVWGLTRYISVAPPSDILIEDVRLMLSHIAWMVVTSEIPTPISTVLLSKLDSLRWELEYRFSVGDVEEIQRAINRLITVKNRLCEELQYGPEYWYNLSTEIS